MLLRPRQQELVERAVAALHLHGNTLAVAPTGAGKTIMLSAIVGDLSRPSPLKACVLAHRDELTEQNEAKFRWVNPHLSTSVFDSTQKSWQGNTTFAMVQTLARKKHLVTMPSLDLLVIDEAHHARAKSYLRIVDHAQALNPKLKLLGMTATPNRGDKKGLHTVFSNVCDQMTLQELIASGHLVRPRTFVMDVGVQQKLKQVRRTAGDYDMEEVAQIMDTYPINSAIVAHWQEKAGNRQTVVFCSTVAHARHVCQAFQNQGFSAVLIHGQMANQEREEALAAYTSGQAQVIVNVAVLTEGWDHPPTSCVVLLRPSSYQSTFIQMIGRGLRTISQEDYPGTIKTDCLILDFGTATLAHGALEQTVDLEDVPQDGKAPSKTCPHCQSTVPAPSRECPLCGYAFLLSANKDRRISLSEEDFTLREVHLLERSPFQWIAPDTEQEALMASGFEAWGYVIHKEGQWYALGGVPKAQPRLLAVGDKLTCLAAANDWMNRRESDSQAHKARKWLALPPTSNQLTYLPEHEGDYNLTRYQASVLLQLKFNTHKIEKVLGGVHAGF